MLKKLAAISLTAGALILAAPTVASAAPSDSYPSPPSAKVGDAIIDTCEVSTVAFGAGFFEPSETVGVSVSGRNAGAAAISGNTAASDGSLTVTFRPPSDGQGAYALDFAGSRPYTAMVTVSHGNTAASSCDHDPGVAAPAGTELPLTGGGMELALTGGSVSPWVLGGGAVALVAGGALVAVGAARRKRA
ncbi:hypothetical protein M4D51_06215 [Microbacterium sp. p3-SID338]|uniref:hypothetical protein n=1 Tax=unclassified Microbacterium TaxID=2609290 RepID=UPI000788D30F|nr:MULTISPECIES: hypothetical protein [unclassified Microbacterium]KYJ99894.1 hypothetical protein AUV07_06880 [Microbacterium sp. CH1]MCT1395317.1 hypothetical protein [Microbacterium sp. p3-SID338]PMC06945.1 hypothetical protein CJ226_03225 [Microbacterium sp. UMB0228]